MWKCHSLCKKRVTDLCIHIYILCTKGNLYFSDCVCFYHFQVELFVLCFHCMGYHWCHFTAAVFLLELCQARCQSHVFVFIWYHCSASLSMNINACVGFITSKVLCCHFLVCCPVIYWNACLYFDKIIWLLLSLLLLKHCLFSVTCVDISKSVPLNYKS